MGTPGAVLARLPWLDILAGLSLAGLLLPEAVAYSSIAHLPPQAGVIALFAGLALYGLVGSSRFAIVSATSSSAAVLAAAFSTMDGPDPNARLAYAVALVMATGLLFLAAAATRMGNITDFIARPVLRGFSFGLGLVIILHQLAGVTGVVPQQDQLFAFVAELLRRHAAWNRDAAALFGAALALLFACARLRHLPAGLLVIVAGILAGKWLPLASHGIALVGQIDLQATMPALPQLAYSRWLQTVQLSLALLLVLYAESYSSIRSFALKHGDVVAPNRDLLALGLANLVSGLFHGLPVGAGYSATAANEAAGARSRLSGAVAAFALFLIMATLLPAIALTPQPVLAAIVVHAISHTLRPALFAPYFQWRRDRLVIVAAVLAVLVFGVIEGLLAAIAVSLLMLLRRMAESSVSVLARLAQGHDFVSLATHPQALPEPHMLVLRPETALFFANAERMLAQANRRIAQAGAELHTVILSLEESPDLDSSSVEALRDFSAALHARGIALLLARLKEPAQRVLLRAALPGLPAAALSALSVDDAVRLARAARSGSESGSGAGSEAGAA